MRVDTWWWNIRMSKSHLLILYCYSSRKRTIRDRTTYIRSMFQSICVCLWRVGEIITVHTERCCTVNTVLVFRVCFRFRFIDVVVVRPENKNRNAQTVVHRHLHGICWKIKTKFRSRFPNALTNAPLRKIDVIRYTVITLNISVIYSSPLNTFIFTPSSHLLNPTARWR